MSAPRKVTAVAFLAAVVCIAVAAAALAGGDRVATGGDPYRVKAERLRSELAKTGLRIRYIHPHGEPTRTVAGVAEFGWAGPIGFEFQLYPSSDQATVRGVGKLRLADFGGPAKIIFEPKVIRGVLGNVAFAEYEIPDPGEEESAPSRKIGLHRQLQVQRLNRSLDDALFNSFPAADPYANALSTTP